MQSESQNSEITLPSSAYINTTIGLKYLNGNKKLYIKVLNSFLTRYQDFDINTLEEKESASELHTLKGLSATLGMETLSKLIQELQENPNTDTIGNFSKTLNLIILDVKNTTL